MKKSFYFLLIIFFTFLSGRSWSQTDSLKSDKKVNPVLLYIGFGGGTNNRGGNIDLNLTITSSGGLGGSIHFISGYLKLQNVPDDFYDTFFPRPTPIDDFTDLSFNIVKKFSTLNKLFRIGFEAGPSWANYDLIELKLNPDWPGLFEYKYNKIHTLKNTLGLSLAMRADFAFYRFFGCDLALFSIINKIEPVIGFDICLNLGMVR